jgi:hypothetical protein
MTLTIMIGGDIRKIGVDGGATRSGLETNTFKAQDPILTGPFLQIAYLRQFLE